MDAIVTIGNTVVNGILSSFLPMATAAVQPAGRLTPWRLAADWRLLLRQSATFVYRNKTCQKKNKRVCGYR